MRRLPALLALPLLAVLAACGSNSSTPAATSSAGAPAATATSAGAPAAAAPPAATASGPALPVGTPTVTGAFGAAPVITIPAGTSPSPTLVVKVLSQGNGALVAAGQNLTVNYTGVNWRTGQPFDSSFDPKFNHVQPATFPIGVGGVIPGWDKGLVGQHLGSRILLVIPPSDGYGPMGGQPSVGIKTDDTLVFVVDLIS